MQTTIKRTDRPRYYQQHGAPMEEPEVKEGTLCPFGRASRACCGSLCALWDDDYCACAMSPQSLYNQIRDAVTDAAVDVARAYREG